MQRLVIALVILGFIAFVYQGIALSSREAAPGSPPSPASLPAR